MTIDLIPDFVLTFESQNGTEYNHRYPMRTTGPMDFVASPPEIKTPTQGLDIRAKHSELILALCEVKAFGGKCHLSNNFFMVHNSLKRNNNM